MNLTSARETKRLEITSDTFIHSTISRQLSNDDNVATDKVNRIIAHGHGHRSLGQTNAFQTFEKVWVVLCSVYSTFMAVLRRPPLVYDPNHVEFDSGLNIYMPEGMDYSW